MATVLRLARAGTKKKPYYHVVAADRRSPRDGRFIEKIGSYDPSNKTPEGVKFKGPRVDHWLSVGALPSVTVGGLIKTWKKQAIADAAAATSEG